VDILKFVIKGYKAATSTTRRRVISVLVLSCIIIGISYFIFKPKDKVDFETVAVTRETIKVTLVANGTIQPRNRIEVKPPISGRIEAILVKEGEEVRKGHILAWMSSTDRATLLDSARMKGEKDLAQWETFYKPIPLIAPMEGTVIAKKMEAGQVVNSTEGILVMSDKLIIRVDVDETDVGQLKLDQEADITFDMYPGEKLEAKVYRIAYESKINNSVVTYEVGLEPHTTPLFMKSGMSVTTKFIVATSTNTLVVPAVAIQQINGQSALLTQSSSRSGQPATNMVQIGITDGQKTEIKSGIKEGEKVLLTTVKPLDKKNPEKTNPLSPWGKRKR